MILWGITAGARNIASGVLMLCGALSHVGDIAKRETEAADIVRQRGIASWYGGAWRGRRTASGTPFDDRAMMAAHLWLPFETTARVTNVQNGRSVDVVVNDHRPYHRAASIDLSAKAAEALGIKNAGPPK